MGNNSIEVVGLGKEYKIGELQSQSDSFREVFTSALTAPFRRARDLMRGEAYGAAGLHETFWALRDISFEVRHGDVVGIIGHNGAGKSTLLKILSRITEPSEGYVDIYGRVGALLEVGTGFHKELTGRENIYLNGAILGMARAEIDRKFDEIVDFAGVERFIDTPVKHYSSGMGLRLGFAVAAHLEPEILVVDEVLAVGDVGFQKKCLGKMSDVASEGRTVLFVSHNLPTVRVLTERVIWLKNGEIFDEGSTNPIVDAYLKDIGDTPSGFIDLTNDRTGGRQPIIQSVSVLQDDVPVSSVPMGEPVTVQVRIKADTPINNPFVGLGIDKAEQGRILSLSTVFVGCDDLPSQVTSGVFECHIDKLYLNEGTYFITVNLVDGRKATIDSVKNSCQFQVVRADVFGSGHTPHEKQGVMILPHHFKFSVD